MVQWSGHQPRAGVTEVQATEEPPDSLRGGPHIAPTFTTWPVRGAAGVLRIHWSTTG